MIPLATTLLTINRVADTSVDSYDAQTYDMYAQHIRATLTVLERGSTVGVLVGGQKETVVMRMACDPVDLLYTDHVVDERTGDVYEVAWVHQRRDIPGVGPDPTFLNYTEAHLVTTQGEV